jgi:hypothetical protein
MLLRRLAPATALLAMTVVVSFARVSSRVPAMTAATSRAPARVAAGSYTYVARLWNDSGLLQDFRFLPELFG